MTGGDALGMGRGMSCDRWGCEEVCHRCDRAELHVVVIDEVDAACLELFSIQCEPNWHAVHVKTRCSRYSRCTHTLPRRREALHSLSSSATSAADERRGHDCVPAICGIQTR